MSFQCKLAATSHINCVKALCFLAWPSFIFWVMREMVSYLNILTNNQYEIIILEITRSAVQMHLLLRSAVLSKENWPCKRADPISRLLASIRIIGTRQKLTVYPPKDLTGRSDRMSHRKWRVTKKQLIWWPADLALLCCCLVSLQFLCDTLSVRPVYPWTT